MKPFKTVTVEYYEEFLGEDRNHKRSIRRIKVVTTTSEWGLSSTHDPLISTSYVYL
jgi:hypothetical protein